MYAASRMYERAAEQARQGRDAQQRARNEPMYDAPSRHPKVRGIQDPYAATVRGRYEAPQDLGRMPPRRDDPMNSFERLGVRGRSKRMDQQLVDRAQDAGRRGSAFKQQTYGPQNLPLNARDDTTDWRRRMTLRPEYTTADQRAFDPTTQPGYNPVNRPRMKLQQYFVQSPQGTSYADTRPATLNRPTMRLRQDFRRDEQPVYYGPPNRPDGYQEPPRMRLRQDFRREEQPVFYGPPNRPDGYEEPPTMRLRQDFRRHNEPLYYSQENRLEQRNEPPKMRIRQDFRRLDEPVYYGPENRPANYKEPKTALRTQGLPYYGPVNRPKSPADYIPQTQAYAGSSSRDSTCRMRPEYRSENRPAGYNDMFMTPPTMMQIPPSQQANSVFYGPANRPDDYDSDEEEFPADRGPDGRAEASASNRIGSEAISFDQRRRDLLEQMRLAKMKLPYLGRSKRPKRDPDGEREGSDRARGA